jgi:hypothetical protein
MTVRTTAGGFVTLCRCGLRAFFTNRADAQTADVEHGWGCRWSA